MYFDGRIKAFHTDRYSAGHRPTNYEKWVTAVRPYRIRYEEVGGRSAQHAGGLTARVFLVHYCRSIQLLHLSPMHQPYCTVFCRALSRT